MQSKAYQSAIIAKSIIQNHSPFKTGNLRYNSIRISNKSDREASIFVDIAIAPYMPFTNEPWTSPKWNGISNPNEGWWEYSVNNAVQTIAQAFGGSVRRVK